MAAVYVPSRAKAYLFGGFDGSGYLDEILVYDPAQDTAPLALAETLPTPLAYAGAVYDETTDRVYLFGGYTGIDKYDYRQEILAFDVTSETVTVLTEFLPWPLARAAVVSIPGEQTVYVMGGTYGFLNRLDTIFRFDIATGSVSDTGMRLDETRSAEAAVYVPEKMSAYLFGGTGSYELLLPNIATLKFAYSISETAQSLKVNVPAIAEVHEALLASDENLQGGAVSYSLSSDGGLTWADVQPGMNHVFASPGRDLRWRATLTGNGESTPLVDNLTITYQGTEAYQTFMPVMLKG
jgi:hypothetical protein